MTRCLLQHIIPRKATTQKTNNIGSSKPESVGARATGFATSFKSSSAASMSSTLGSGVVGGNVTAGGLFRQLLSPFASMLSMWSNKVGRPVGIALSGNSYVASYGRWL
eukprot:gnl/TRDRNA2_/TRDRNA2_160774_c0_seq4.p1 gnl/TRDRNA2_/TRDRNA2_160774_c0~~gnl/TRDRNA2_/TRDRNA2_160774_c0_seq4.p1  ORF type:complete len:108 (-),score=9.76 gnl/TRDRNA2_/TRDRNA2_160774_c0_seq4:41-364(-)